MHRFTSFKQFWPHYLKEHSKKDTRLLHFAGSAFALIFILLGLVIDAALLVFAPLFGYGFAWISHVFIEKNEPLTLKYPLWSLIADYKMFLLIGMGKIDHELHRHNIQESSSI